MTPALKKDRSQLTREGKRVILLRGTACAKHKGVNCIWEPWADGTSKV